MNNERKIIGLNWVKYAEYQRLFIKIVQENVKKPFKYYFTFDKLGWVLHLYILKNGKAYAVDEYFPNSQLEHMAVTTQKPLKVIREFIEYLINSGKAKIKNSYEGK